MVDLTPQRRNAKGEIISNNPYSCHIINGIKVFKQPGIFEGYELENGQRCDAQGNVLTQPKQPAQPEVAPPKNVSTPFEKGQSNVNKT